MKGDFKNAHTCAAFYHQYKDSLQKLSKEKDLLSLEIDNENRRKAREATQQEVELTRRHNIQYMGMAVGIVAIFHFIGNGRNFQGFNEYDQSIRVLCLYFPF